MGVARIIVGEDDDEDDKDDSDNNNDDNIVSVGWIRYDTSMRFFFGFGFFEMYRPSNGAKVFQFFQVCVFLDGSRLFILVTPDPRFICPCPLNRILSRYSMLDEVEGRVGVGGEVCGVVIVILRARCSLIYCALGVWLRSSSSLVA